MFGKKGVLANFAKFTGKHLCQSLFFNKVAGLSLQTLLKKRLWYSCFPVNFAKFLRTLFLTEHLQWLLLNHLIMFTKGFCQSYFVAKSMNVIKNHFFSGFVTDGVTSILRKKYCVKHLVFAECAKFRGSRAIVGLVGLVPSCSCVFVGPKIFLAGISWV